MEHLQRDDHDPHLAAFRGADLFIVVVKTNPAEGAKGISLVLVEGKREGFIRGRNLDKIGQKSADTSELFFDNVRVPVSNLLGEENKGFVYLITQLPEERISLAVSAQGSAQRALDEAVGFAKSRHAQSQAVRFLLADLKAKIQVGWAHLDWSLSRLVQNRLTPADTK